MISKFNEFVNESKKTELSKGDQVKVTNISTLDTKAKKYQGKIGVVTGVSGDYVQVKIDSSKGGEVEFRTSELEKVNEGVLNETKSHDKLVQTMLNLEDKFYNSVLAALKKAYPVGSYSMGEDWYPGNSDKLERANDIINKLIELGYVKLEDPDNPEESLIMYK